MLRLTLRRRLFWSHLLVVLVGLFSYGWISQLSSFHLYSLHLADLGNRGLLQVAPELLLDGLESAWTYSSFLALGIGAVAASALSYWITQRINQPIAEIEHIAQRFATGHLQERIPPNRIPELNRLGHSLNQMAFALENTELSRRQMVGDLSHELRTPLTVMRGYLEELSSDRLKATPALFGQLLKETQRLERLVNDLQDLSKVESGSLQLAILPMDLRPMLLDLQERFEGQISEDGPALRVEFGPDLPWALGDRDRTEQILVNLLGNAICHTTQGEIILRAWAEDRDWLWIAVEDTGCGIAAADLEHVFERFWRSPQARAEHQKGSGLGLAISQRLAALQGGQISATSQLGQGSRFCLGLPQATPPK